MTKTASDVPRRTLPDSLWAATAEPAPVTQPLDTDRQVDVAIVGAGFTGLRTALTLAGAGAQVVVLDAGDIGWGASGRNGGQVNPIGHEAPEVIRQRWRSSHDEKFAERYLSMTIQSADELFSLVREHGIVCDADQGGWIRAVHGPAALPAFEKLYQGWLAAGADLRWIDRAQLQEISGCHCYRAGWIARQGGSVQPLSYARGLAAAALAAGAGIHTHTEVSALKPSAVGWTLVTDRGNVSAKQVIVGTNGYTDRLVPGLRESIVPVVSVSRGAMH